MARRHTPHDQKLVGLGAEIVGRLRASAVGIVHDRAFYDPDRLRVRV
jgi:hypothetical protein